MRIWGRQGRNALQLITGRPGADGVGFTEDVVLGRPIWYKQKASFAGLLTSPSHWTGCKNGKRESECWARPVLFYGFFVALTRDFRIQAVVSHFPKNHPGPIHWNPLESRIIFVQMTRPSAVFKKSAPVVTEAAQSALAKVLNQVFFLIRMCRNSQVFQDFGNLLH